MITTCTHCQVRYQLDDDKVPRRLIRVRCPECQGVFSLDGRERQESPEEPVRAPAASESVTRVEPPAAAPAEVVPAPVAATPPPPEPEPDPEPEPEPEQEAAPEPVVDVGRSSGPAPASAERRQNGGVAVVEKAATSTRRRRPKEQMLARALVSDILVYNRKARDEALAAGNLHEALGAEIKKCWELYKEKVTPEVANNTNYFREALNEILAEGKEVF